MWRTTVMGNPGREYQGGPKLDTRSGRGTHRGARRPDECQWKVNGRGTLLIDAPPSACPHKKSAQRSA